jgi:hypothetical protein
MTTPAFNEFIAERERIKTSDPSIRLFDEIIISKKNRGARSHFKFLHKTSTDFLSDTSTHRWYTASAIFSTANGSSGAVPFQSFVPMHSAANSTSTAGSMAGSGSGASNSIGFGGLKIPGDYRAVVGRTPAKLDATLMKEPKIVQGAPRVVKTAGADIGGGNGGRDGSSGGLGFRMRRRPLVTIPKSEEHGNGL